MNGGSGVMKGHKRDLQSAPGSPHQVIVLDPVSLAPRTISMSAEGSTSSMHEALESPKDLLTSK